jgi:CspA family cold shock protein
LATALEASAHALLLHSQNIDWQSVHIRMFALVHFTSSYQGIQTMQTGTVKWFNAQKGYGFIQPASGGPDVFVHISAVERAGLGSLNEGQKVTYEVVSDRRTGKSSADRLAAA